MANEPNQTPTPEPQMNSAEVRDANGQIKDQASTQQSGTDQKTNTDPAPEPKKGSTFLNQKDEPKPEPKKEEPKAEPKLDADGNPIKEEPKEEPKTGAPEKYEDFKLPNGYKFEDGMKARVDGLFKELNLTQEGAQKLVDLYSEAGIKTAKLAGEANEKLWNDTNAGWTKEIEDTWGDKAKTMRTDINKGLDAAFPNQKLNAAIREGLDITGAGSHPALFEALAILTKPFTEGTPVVPGGISKDANRDPAKAQPISPADAMYGHLRK